MIADDTRESARWALIMLAFGIGITTDSLVQRIAEGVYRVGWWIRRLFERLGERVYRAGWWIRRLLGRLRGGVVDAFTAAGNLYFRTAEWIALRYRRRR